MKWEIYVEMVYHDWDNILKDDTFSLGDISKLDLESSLANSNFSLIESSI